MGSPLSLECSTPFRLEVEMTQLNFFLRKPCIGGGHGFQLFTTKILSPSIAEEKCFNSMFSF